MTVHRGRPVTRESRRRPETLAAPLSLPLPRFQVEPRGTSRDIKNGHFVTGPPHRILNLRTASSSGGLRTARTAVTFSPTYLPDFQTYSYTIAEILLTGAGN